MANEKNEAWLNEPVDIGTGVVTRKELMCYPVVDDLGNGTYAVKEVSYMPIFILGFMIFELVSFITAIAAFVLHAGVFATLAIIGKEFLVIMLLMFALVEYAVRLRRKEASAEKAVEI